MVYKFLKTIILLAVCLNLVTLTACAKKYHLNRYKNVQTYFEEDIDSGLRQFILDDLTLVFQHNKKLEIQNVIHKQKTMQGTKERKGSYLKFEGAKIIPSKLRGKLGKTVTENDKNGLLINKEIIEEYKIMYKQKASYQKLHHEIKTFVEFINNMENISEEQFPAIKGVVYMYGFTDEEMKKIYSDINKKKSRSDLIKEYKNITIFIPALIAIKPIEGFGDEVQKKLAVEMIIKYKGKLTEGFPLIKDQGKWKLFHPLISG